METFTRCNTDAKSHNFIDDDVNFPLLDFHVTEVKQMSNLSKCSLQYQDRTTDRRDIYYERTLTGDWDDLYQPRGRLRQIRQTNYQPSQQIFLIFSFYIE